MPSFRPQHPIQPSLALTLLNATLTNHLASIDSKQLTGKLNPSESTLTKNIGRGVVMVNQIPNERIGPFALACPELRRESPRERSLARPARRRQAFSLC